MHELYVPFHLPSSILCLPPTFWIPSVFNPQPPSPKWPNSPHAIAQSGLFHEISRNPGTKICWCQLPSSEHVWTCSMADVGRCLTSCWSDNCCQDFSSSNIQNYPILSEDPPFITSKNTLRKPQRDHLSSPISIKYFWWKNHSHQLEQVDLQIKALLHNLPPDKEIILLNTWNVWGNCLCCHPFHHVLLWNSVSVPCVSCLNLMSAVYFSLCLVLWQVCAFDWDFIIYLPIKLSRNPSVLSSVILFHLFNPWSFYWPLWTACLHFSDLCLVLSHFLPLICSNQTPIFTLLAVSDLQDSTTIFHLFFFWFFSYKPLWKFNFFKDCHNPPQPSTSLQPHSHQHKMNPGHKGIKVFAVPSAISNSPSQMTEIKLAF